VSGTAHESRRDEIAAYLLGALDSEETASLERHLATGCVECRAELRWLGPAVRLLPESVPRVEPPPGLRQRLLEEARSDLEPEANTGRRERRPLFAGWRPLAGFAALALIAAAVAGFAIGGGSSGGESMTVVAGRPPGVTARIEGEGDAATLRLANVHQLPPDRVLEAWVRRGGRVVPVSGVFLPDREGRAMTMIPDIHGVEMVMVTSEPRSGSAAPTSAPMVTAKIEAG
jgi:anti-sigma-K factor RskA